MIKLNTKEIFIVLQVVATLISSVLVDRAGRRVLLILSGAVMAVCCTALGLYFQMRAWGHNVSGLGWLPLSSLCLYFLVFSLGFGPIPWVMLGELFAPDVKGISSSIASSICWTLTFLTTFVFEDVVSLIGEGFTFCIFAVMCILGVVFTVLIVPETKGKTLNEIQREMGLH
jgi:MFS family permease